MMHANSREEIEECYAGDIVAGVGLKQTSTGDTLCAPDAPIVLEQIEFPEPVIAVAIEPKTKADQEKLGDSLGRLSEEDPTFQVESDDETGQTLIHGMGELHLEVLVDRMLREFSVDANVGKPQVAYRETIRKRVEKVNGKFVRQTGGRGQYGHAVINIEPAPGEGFDFVNKIKGGTIPTEYIPSVEQGDRGGAAVGRQGRLPDGRRPRSSWSTAPTTTSTPRRWPSRSPARWPCRRARARRSPVLLEPVMNGRGGHARGVPRRRDRRPQPTPRQGPGPGAARQRARGPRLRAARRDVRLRDRRALLDPGPRQLHDAVRALRGGPGQHRRGDRRAPLGRAGREPPS